MYNLDKANSTENLLFIYIDSQTNIRLVKTPSRDLLFKTIKIRGKSYDLVPNIAVFNNTLIPDCIITKEGLLIEFEGKHIKSFLRHPLDSIICDYLISFYNTTSNVNILILLAYANNGLFSNRMFYAIHPLKQLQDNFKTPREFFFLVIKKFNEHGILDKEEYAELVKFCKSFNFPFLEEKSDKEIKEYSDLYNISYYHAFRELFCVGFNDSVFNDEHSFGLTNRFQFNELFNTVFEEDFMTSAEYARLEFTHSYSNTRTIISIINLFNFGLSKDEIIRILTKKLNDENTHESDLFDNYVESINKITVGLN